MSDEDLQQTARDTSERVQPPDPYTEPPNSTVDDWFGQRVEHDAEEAERQSADTANGEGDPDAPGNFVDDGQADAVPEPNEPA